MCINTNTGAPRVACVRAPGLCYVAYPPVAAQLFWFETQFDINVLCVVGEVRPRPCAHVGLCVACAAGQPARLVHLVSVVVCLQHLSGG